MTIDPSQNSTFAGEISVNSISSVNNTDLKLESTGTGDILLNANPNVGGAGKIHLSRGDNDTVRFSTIEYRSFPGSAYIKFLVHDGSNTTSQTEVLKLNGNGSSEFSGNVGIGNTSSTSFRLYVSVAGHFGDSFDATAYGQLQVTRPATQ